MELDFAQELHSDSLHINKERRGPTSTGNCKLVLEGVLQQDSYEDCVCHEDGSLWDGSEAGNNNSSDLKREWERRRDQFFTIGYRDGITAGKEASAQKGFNMGYKQSVHSGYNWGLVRGVTSALVFLPDGLKEKLVKSHEERQKWKNLYKYVHSLSTSDALRLLDNDIFSSDRTRRIENCEATHEAISLEQNSKPSQIGSYVGELMDMLAESPAVEIHLAVSASSCELYSEMTELWTRKNLIARK